MISLLYARLLVSLALASILSTTYLALLSARRSPSSFLLDTFAVGSPSESAGGAAIAADFLSTIGLDLSPIRRGKDKSSPTSSSTPSADLRSADRNAEDESDPLPSAMDEAVRMLFSSNPDRAEQYIRQYPANKFRFFVYNNLRKDRTWQYLSKCIEDKLNVAGVEGNKYGNNTSNCDWGSSICTETQRSSGRYSSRRFNRNGDVVLSKIFSEYQGKLRTYNPDEADVFIVPYASTAHCACKNTAARCFKVKSKHVKQVFDKLDHLNTSTLSRHVFMNSAQADVAHPLMRKQPLLIGLEPNTKLSKLGINSGHVSIPYVNTNPEFQPNRLLADGATAKDNRPQWWKVPADRTYSISAIFFRTAIKSDEQNLREQYYLAVQQYIEQNKTIAGRPLYVSDQRVDKEHSLYEIYRDSIFCPCLHGDTPGQKRIFDVMLNGCIPVVLEYEKSHEERYPSHFEHEGASTRIVYPFAKGNFFSESGMGIDYGDLIVPINGKCGIPCLIPTLEELLLKHPDHVLQMQRNMAKVVRLFSFGMEHNALKYPDAIAAALVQVRHFVVHDKDVLASNGQ